VGPFALADADEEHVVPLAAALSFLPECPLSAVEADGVRHGRAVEKPGGAGDQGSAVRLTAGGELLAVARRRGDLLKPETVLN
jgi:hypothetical protein